MPKRRRHRGKNKQAKPKEVTPIEKLTTHEKMILAEAVQDKQSAILHKLFVGSFKPSDTAIIERLKVKSHEVYFRTVS